MNPKPNMPRLRGFLRDRRGVAALEAAMVIPVTIPLLFGVYELTQAYRARMKLAHSTALFSNMVAQESLLVGGDLRGMCQLASDAMVPFNNGMFSASVRSTSKNASGTVTTDWSRNAVCNNGAPAATAPDSKLLEGPGASIISVTASYQYVPAIRLFFGPVTFEQSIFVRPRSNSTIQCQSCS